jgi:hypothetical protein
MGQPITVAEKPSSNPAILRIETNRPLTGMGHERYTQAPPELLDRPVDELARRLFATGDVAAVHVHGSIVTITLQGGRTGTGLADVVRGLFRHYADDASPASPSEGEAAPEGEAGPEGEAAPQG